MAAIAPSRELLLGGRRVTLGQRPWLMGVVNATPDSFSDSVAETEAGVEQRLRRVSALLDAGADMIDIGGESGVTNRRPVTVEEEIDRVAQLISRAVSELGALVSVDTYKPLVAQAALDAGAIMVNDVSGVANPELAKVCARAGAALVIMHTRAAPKQRLQDPGLYDDVTADVIGFLRERIQTAQGQGLSPEQLVIDPGPDFTKTPHQTVELLRRLDELHALGRPVLLAVSRKDFVGAITGRRPRARLAGTLAAVGDGVDRGAHIIRVHDVAETVDFLAVRGALRGLTELDPALLLDDTLRSEQSII